MSQIVPELTRPIAVDALREHGADFTVEASEAERAALARRFAVLAIDSLSATFHAQPVGNGMVRLAGRLQALVHQACVVTLVDVPQSIDESFERLYSPAAAAVEEEAGGEIELDVASDDPPDPLIDGTIDIGEVAAEQLALALDPYPRAPGAMFEAPADEGGAPASPFAALAKRRKE